MPKKPSSTVWSKASLTGLIVEANDFTEVKNAINNHRTFIANNGNQYHGGNLTGNYNFTTTEIAGNNVTYNSINDIKKAINAFYFGNNPTVPYTDVSTTKTGEIIKAEDLSVLRDKVNYIETNCVACDTCQFSTWSGQWSSDWSGDWSGQWSGNWSGQWGGQWSGNWSGQWGSDACPACPACPDASWSSAWHANK